MRLRILKKKSKQAKNMLIELGMMKESDFFTAEKLENYHETDIRCGCHDPFCNCSYHPLKGTPMTGERVGHEYQEWEEKTAFDVLFDMVNRGELEGNKRALKLSGLKLYAGDTIFNPFEV